MVHAKSYCDTTYRAMFNTIPCKVMVLCKEPSTPDNVLVNNLKQASRNK